MFEHIIFQLKNKIKLPQQTVQRASNYDKCQKWSKISKIITSFLVACVYGLNTNSYYGVFFFI